MADQRQSGRRRRAPGSSSRSSSDGSSRSSPDGSRRSDSGGGQRRKSPSARSDARRRTQRGRPPRKRRHAVRRGRGVLFHLFAMLLVVAVIFFKVTDIQVAGCQLYTSEQVIQASEIQMGDNLLLLSRSAAAARIRVTLPYVDEVRINRVLPGTVSIQVTETDAAFAVAAADGSTWLTDASGKLLEPAVEGAADYPKLTGITAIDPKAGSQIETEQTGNLTVARHLLELLGETELVSKVTEINVEKTYDIRIWYGDQYEIRLGGSDELSYKLRYLLSILDQLDNPRGGIIDLTLEEKNVAIFREWDSDFSTGTESRNTGSEENTDENSQASY